ncbi:MAG: proton-conducting transporter membrane subunit, partial [Oscillospiraceae bacterium]
QVTNILFVFAILGMIIGSIDAIRETNIKRMIAFSSVAQIGYIYMGIGLGTQAGLVAACFHIIVHAITKPMLFSAAGGLADASGHNKHFDKLVGSAYRNPIAGFAFALGSFSMIGIPFFAGFATKYYLASAAMQVPGKMWLALFALAVSTVLNAVYYIKALAIIFFKEKQNTVKYKNPKTYIIGMSAFIVANILMGLFYQPVVDIIIQGMKVF